MKHGKEYVKMLIDYLQNFEEIINNKKQRKKRKNIK